ncbi:MAG: hypothetical protein ABIL25_07685 [candidate division WOR-3 bacterium]
MPTDPTKRIDGWDKKFNVERISAILTERRPKMLEHVNSAYVSLASMEGQVKQVLDQEGVSIITYPFYLNFGREMWHLSQIDVSGEALAVEAATLIGKWVARGLSRSVLETIRTQVFNIGPPTP